MQMQFWNICISSLVSMGHCMVLSFYRVIGETHNYIPYGSNNRSFHYFIQLDIAATKNENREIIIDIDFK